MKRIQSLRILIIFSFLLIAGLVAEAHYPPVSGQTDCGIIQGGVFYSEYYTPGNPNGTPEVSGSCRWIQTSNTKCKTVYYGSTPVNIYPHKFVCNVPLDTNSYLLLSFVGIFGFFKLRKYAPYSFTHNNEIL